MNALKKLSIGMLTFATGTGTLMAQSGSDEKAAMVAGGIVGLLFMFIYVGVLLVVIIGQWKVFTKAGQPGWAILIPIYNLIVLWQISKQPVWTIILCFIPVLNVIGIIMIIAGVAKSFGKGAGFVLGLLFLPFIFYPILGFGDAQYQG